MRREITVWVLGTFGALVAMALVAFAIQGTDFFLYKTLVCPGSGKPPRDGMTNTAAEPRQPRRA